MLLITGTFYPDCCLSFRYFPLLAKQKLGHPEYDILSNVFALLSAKSLCEVTAGVVMDMTDSLLNTPDFEPSDNLCSLTVSDTVFAEVDEKSGGRNVQKSDYCKQIF